NAYKETRSSTPGGDTSGAKAWKATYGASRSTAVRISDGRGDGPALPGSPHAATNRTSTRGRAIRILYLLTRSEQKGSIKVPGSASRPYRPIHSATRIASTAPPSTFVPGRWLSFVTRPRIG